jgi:dihydroxyacetone kinase-like predicted kinase
MADPVNETFEENIASMKDSMEHLTAAEVCPAIRDSVNNGIQIKKGDLYCDQRRNGGGGQS